MNEVKQPTIILYCITYKQTVIEIQDTNYNIRLTLLSHGIPEICRKIRNIISSFGYERSENIYIKVSKELYNDLITPNIVNPQTNICNLFKKEGVLLEQIK